jgi:lysophospholipase L1-like esterase
MFERILKRFKDFIDKQCQKILVLVIIAIFSFLICGDCGQRSFGSNHYSMMTPFHFRMDKNMPSGMIYFIGDSHTQGLATQSIVASSVNYGIGSDTTVGVLNRIRFYNSLASAKALVLAIGFNDLKQRSAQETSKNIEKIINQIPAIIVIFLNDVFPVNSNTKLYPSIGRKIKQLNKNIANICENYQNVNCIDTYNYMIDIDSLSIKYDIGDGIHLNEKGYKLWISLIKQQLMKRKLYK